MNFPGEYPQAHRLDIEEPLPAPNGPIQVADPYRWLETESDPDTQSWMSAQDDLYAAHAATWPGRERLAARLGELMTTGHVGLPVWRGERKFFTQRSGTQEHSIVCVEEAGTVRTLIDPMALDPTGTTTLDAWQPCKEGRLLAYQISSGGTEESQVFVLDVTSGDVVEGPIDRARYSPIAWLPGGESYLYVRRLAPELLPADEQQYHRRIYWHVVGADTATDVEVFGAGLAVRNYYSVSVSQCGTWAIATAMHGTDPQTDVYIAALASATPHELDWTEVITGHDAKTGAYVDRSGRLWIHTDLAAPRGRVLVADPKQPTQEHWREVIAEHPEAVLEDFAVLEGADGERIATMWTRHAVSELTVRDLDGGAEHTITLPGVGTIAGMTARPDGGPDLWFMYTDFAMPPHVYTYSCTDDSVELYARPPGVVELPNVRTAHVAYPSVDGTTVRMFVISRADTVDAAGQPLSPSPTILYGYGGFGHTMSPGFSANILAWVEAGGRYVIAGLRGGCEEGEQWHRDGMLGNKQNVFDDFISAAKTLAADGWTTANQLAISGGSNGGLLVGAATTQAPEAFSAVVCSAPLLDMVRYQLHGLGATWAGEYGDANDPEHLAWLHAYSPYHNVNDGVNYPAVLFTVFGGDTRVDPLHARKLCAALQHATNGTTENRPILIRQERNVGHGARAVSKTVELSAESLAFMARYTGLDLAHTEQGRS